MANMFKETSKHKSPVSVEDSVKTDKVISELWSWCSGVETLGNFDYNRNYYFNYCRF